MKEKSYEVCILGCGIAGSTLAYNLASHADVCAIEKKDPDELGCDPCGNAVHRSWFDGGGVEPGPEKFGAVASSSEEIELTISDETFRADLPARREGLILDKDVFVQGMFDTAVDCGVDFIRGRAVPEFEDGAVKYVEVGERRIEADIYIDASGLSAVLRSEFNSVSDDTFFYAYREILDSEPDFDCWRIYQFEPNVAFWAFPQGTRVNLGVVAFVDDVDLKSQVRDLKSRIGLEGADIEDAGMAPIISIDPIDLVYGNVVAIGDAGGTVNPVTGGGIGPSMKVANILSDVIENGEKLERVQERYMEEVAGSYGRNYKLSRVFLRLQRRFFWEKVPKWAFEKFYGGKKVEG